jgi:chemotaxis protein MotB
MDKRPIIVIKKKGGHGGHHGGAWKVAYADFVTAMMSLFIVLWLLNSTPQVKKAIAGYFNDPRSSGKETGSKTLGAGESVSIDRQNVEKLKEEIEKAILKQADLAKLSKQVEITVTGEGLKIELIEDQGGTFFESGSPNPTANGDKLLAMLAEQVKTLPNHLLLEGHTDAQPYTSDRGYTNWELSSDRANSARRQLQSGGIGATQIAQVRGYADQELRLPDKPLDPSNRRISIIVEWLDAAPASPEAAASPAPGEAKPGAESAGQAEPANADGKPTQPIVPDTKAATDAKPEASAPTAAVQPAAVVTKPLPAAAKPSILARIESIVPGKKK